jgi:tape measure domain-containing protein
MDASNFSQGADLARAEVNKVAAAIRNGTPPAEKFQRDLELLNKAFSEAGKQSSHYANALDHLQKKYQQGQYSAEAMAAAQKREADTKQALIAATKRDAEAKDAARAAGLRVQKQLQDEATATEQARAALQKRLVEFKRAKAEEAKAAELAASRMKQSIDSLVKKEQEHQAAMQRKSATLRSVQADIERSTQSNNGLINSVKGLAAAYVSFQGIKTGITIASDMEQAAIAFEVMTGSAAQGKKTLGDLRKFAAATPITLSGAQAAARTLMTFNDDGKDLIPTLTAIGNIAGGNNERFINLTLAFAQTQAAGRLMGQEVLQMVNAGFNPLTEMSKRLGISMPELKKQMEAGGISAAMVKESFMALGGEGGRLGSMMDRMGKTAAGALSQLQSSVQELVAQVGTHFLPILASMAKQTEAVVRATSTLIAGFDQGQVELLAMVGAFTATVIIMPKVIAGIQLVIGALRAMTTAQSIALAFGGPKGWAILAASAAASAVAVKMVGDAFDGLAESAEAATGDDSAGKKAAEAAKAAAAAVEGVASSASPAVKQFNEMEKSLEDQIKLLQLGEEKFEQMQLYMSGMSFEQQQRIQQLREELKIAEEMKRKQDELSEAQKKQAEDRKRQLEEIEAAFTKDIEQALTAAKQYFEQERQRDNERRKAVSAGPTSIEVGSGEAAKFMADQANARIGAAAVPAKPTPGEAEIARKTQELLVAQRAANVAQDKELKTMQDLLVQFKENGFKRAR